MNFLHQRMALFNQKRAVCQLFFFAPVPVAEEPGLFVSGSAGESALRAFPA